METERGRGGGRKERDYASKRKALHYMLRALIHSLYTFKSPAPSPDMTLSARGLERPPAPTLHKTGPAYTRTHTHSHTQQRAGKHPSKHDETHAHGGGDEPPLPQGGEIKGGHVTDWSRFVTLRRARRAVSIICEGSLDSSVSIAAAETCIEACSAGS